MVIAFHKPYGVLSQFSPEPGSAWRALREFRFPGGVYAAGRLDADSEGLLILSDEGNVIEALLEPRREHPREYWAQVEGLVGEEALRRLERGVEILKGYRTLPAKAWRIDPAPGVPPREPPIRVRKSVPDCWIGLELIEGKNRQVRRMTAAVGHPTLRLIRARIGGLRLEALGIGAGEWRELSAAERRQLLAVR